jgi:conjugative relaxase-like TrwC/TraI family protein
MLTITKARKATRGAGYYIKYYATDSDGKLLVYGKGAELFGLKDELTRKQFYNLFNGFSPDGKTAFFKNSNHPERNAFWDLTFSVPKSVSVMWMAASPEVQKEIDAIVFEAVKKTLDLVQERYGLARRGAKGLEWVPAALTFALARHISSREDEAQLHYHCLLFNDGICQDGTVRTLQTKPLFQAEMTLGLFFRNEIAQGMKQRLHVGIIEEKVGFHIEGVPKALCDSNSTRKHQVEGYMKEHNLLGGKAAKLAALNTRKPKSNIKPPELTARWRESAAAAGWTESEVNKLVGKSLRPEVKHQFTPGIGADETFFSQNGGAAFPQISESNARPHIAPVLALSWNTAQSEKPQENPFKIWPEKTPEKPLSDEEKQAKAKSDLISLKAFRAELRKATDRVFPENQTRRKIEKVAFGIGRKFKIPSKEILDAIDDLKLPYQKFLFRLEWKPIFPSAPRWNPASKLRTPRIVVFNKPRKWGEIYYSKPIPAFFGPKKEFRIQERRLFPKAPGWSPFSKMSVKAMRVAPYREHAHRDKEKEKNEKSLNH